MLSAMIDDQTELIIHTSPLPILGYCIVLYCTVQRFPRHTVKFLRTAAKACELRDGGDRYGGKGVLKAVGNVNDVLGPLVVGMDPTKQQEIDDVRARDAAYGLRTPASLDPRVVHFSLTS